MSKKPLEKRVPSPDEGMFLQRVGHLDPFASYGTIVPKTKSLNKISTIVVQNYYFSMKNNIP